MFKDELAGAVSVKSTSIATATSVYGLQCTSCPCYWLEQGDLISALDMALALNEMRL